MKFIKTEIPDVYIIEPSVFGDDRGYFLESFNLEKFEEKYILLNLYKTMNLNPLKEFKRVAFSKATI